MPVQKTIMSCLESGIHSGKPIAHYKEKNGVML